MGSQRDQEHISTLTLVQRLLWWPENAIQKSNENFFFFETVTNLEKRTTEMSSEGQKMEKKEVWVGLKWPENTKIRRPELAAATVFAGPDPGALDGGCP